MQYFESSDGRWRIYVVEINGIAHYRLMNFAGFYEGDFTDLQTLLRKVDIELGDLIERDD